MENLNIGDEVVIKTCDVFSNGIIKEIFIGKHGLKFFNILFTDGIYDWYDQYKILQDDSDSLDNLSFILPIKIIEKLKSIS